MDPVLTMTAPAAPVIPAPAPAATPVNAQPASGNSATSSGTETSPASGSRVPGAVKTPEKTPESKSSPSNPDLLPRPLMGRYKTFAEAEDAYRRSQDEGLRLYNEHKALKESLDKSVADREARIRALESDLEIARTVPPFRELSKEEAASLKKENPGDYADYMLSKDRHDREIYEKKQSREKEDNQRIEMQRSMDEYVTRSDEYMARTPEKYPQYRELQDVQRQLIDLTRVGKFSPLTGHKWTPELLYYASLGFTHHQALLAGDKEQSSAAEAAKQKADADAAAGRGSQPGPGNRPESGGIESDAEFGARLIAAAPKHLFGGART
jgi:hypothetical protein